MDLKGFKKMKNYTSSYKLIKLTGNFLTINYCTFFHNFFHVKGVFYGWGRKQSGLNAVELANKYNSSYVLLEDGFIRSLDLGVNGSPSFSIVEDDIGIYYDATAPSRLENILNTYDFTSDIQLTQDAKMAMELIVKYNISKYNTSVDVPKGYFEEKEEKRVLVVAQTAGDASLKYGMLDDYTTDDVINAALSENPDVKVYIKIHPDVLSGKKKSDINIDAVQQKCVIIEENFNPISLLKHFDKVYTKTSQMGFEALLVGCECVCFGMPFYAGWGVTTDKSECKRRKIKRSVEEIFSAAYILYTRYYNPYTKKESDIFDIMTEIIQRREDG